MMANPLIRMTQQGILAVLRREFPAGAQRQDLLDFIAGHLMSPRAHPGRKGRLARQLYVILDGLCFNGQVVSDGGMIFSLDPTRPRPVGGYGVEGVPALSRPLHQKLFIALRAEESGSVQRQQAAQCRFLHAAAEAGWTLDRGIAALGLSKLGGEILVAACPSLRCLLPQPIPEKHAIKEFRPKKPGNGQAEPLGGAPEHEQGPPGEDHPLLGRLLHKKLFLALLAVDRGSTERQQEAQCDFVQEAIASGWRLDQAVAALGLSQGAGDALVGQFPVLQDLARQASVEAEASAAEPRRRRRTRKVAVEEVATPGEAAKPEALPQPERRGRPPKPKPEPVAVVPKKRGRPRKIRLEGEEPAPKRKYKKRKKNTFNQPWRKGTQSSQPAATKQETPVDLLLPEVARYMRHEQVHRLPVHRMLDDLVRELRLDGVAERSLSYALMRERMHSLRRSGMSMIEARWRIRQEFDGYVIPGPG